MQSIQHLVERSAWDRVDIGPAHLCEQPAYYRVLDSVGIRCLAQGRCAKCNGLGFFEHAYLRHLGVIKQFGEPADRVDRSIGHLAHHLNQLQSLEVIGSVVLLCRSNVNPGRQQTLAPVVLD